MFDSPLEIPLGLGILGVITAVIVRAVVKNKPRK